ncbi:MAG: YlbF family regulator [Clostridia bacterium]|nr:YlbF family regulator [Clostridia bacterium]
MEIFELAAELGKALKADERLVKLEEAKKAYEENKTLQRNIVEFDVQQKALQQEMIKPEKDTIFIEVIQKRIDELYKMITEDADFVALNEAQAVVNELMNSVNSTITYNITGELPSSCTHDCSSCGGCH